MATIPTHVQTEDRRFVRDTHSKALLNQDRNALERHRIARQRAAENIQLRKEVTVLTRMCQRFESRLQELTVLIEQVATVK